MGVMVRSPLKVFKEVLRYFGIFIFGIVFLFSVTRSIFSTLLSLVGILILIPNLNKITEKKLNFILPTWAKILGIFVILFILPFSYPSSFDNEDSKLDNLTKTSSIKSATISEQIIVGDVQSDTSATVAKSNENNIENTPKLTSEEELFKLIYPAVDFQLQDLLVGIGGGFYVGSEADRLNEKNKDKKIFGELKIVEIKEGMFGGGYALAKLPEDVFTTLVKLEFASDSEFDKAKNIPINAIEFLGVFEGIVSNTVYIEDVQVINSETLIRLQQISNKYSPNALPDIAINESKLYLCDLLNGDDLRICRWRYYIAKEDVEGCLTLPPREGKRDEPGTCIRDIAVKTKNPALCEKIDWSVVKEGCLRGASN